MPRSSPYSITLWRAEEVELRRRASKYTLPYFQVQRAKMILHAAEGMPNDQIAACLDTRREVVCLWRKRFFADRPAVWKNMLVRVAPGFFPPDLVVQVKALACELARSTRSSPISLEHYRLGSRGATERLGGFRQRQHAVALAAPRHHSTVVSPQLGVSA